MPEIGQDSINVTIDNGALAPVPITGTAENVAVTIGAALPAGTALLGKVGIDQTTPGTTNAVDVKIGNVTPQLDDTDKLAVSLYAKQSAAGDGLLRMSTAGALFIAGAEAVTGADAITNTVLSRMLTAGGTLAMLMVVPYAFNGATWDRQRSNEAVTLLASAARTATVSSADQVNYNGRGVVVFINVSALADTPSVVFAIEEKDPIGGLYRVTLQTLGLTATGLTVLWQYPGCNVVANQRENIPLSRTWRVTATHADPDSITYSVSATTLV